MHLSLLPLRVTNRNSSSCLHYFNFKGKVIFLFVFFCFFRRFSVMSFYSILFSEFSCGIPRICSCRSQIGCRSQLYDGLVDCLAGCLVDCMENETSYPTALLHSVFSVFLRSRSFPLCSYPSLFSTPLSRFPTLLRSHLEIPFHPMFATYTPVST